MSRISLLKLRKILVSLGVLSVVFIGGFYVGQSRRVTVTTAENGAPQVMIDRFVSSQRNVDFNLFWEVWDKMKTEHIDRVKLDDSKMVYNAIKGMVSAAGDPYTIFLTPEENKQAKDDLNGAFEGVGIELGYKEFQGTNRLAVISPLEGMPAERAGVKAGDLIIKIDGEDTAGLVLPEAVKKIRGKKGTVVKLALLSEKEEETHDVEITRETISVASVELEWVFGRDDPSSTRDHPSNNSEGKIAHIKVTRFGDQTMKEWNEAVGEIVRSGPGGLQGIILDVRGNPGGYFQSAIELASDFVDSGVVVQQESPDGQREQFRANGSARLVKYPLVVLVDGGSASASEILAGALRDLRQVKIVGEKSFGKGSVQEAEDLKGGAGLHVTIYRWLLPSGDWIDKKGIEPDVKVEDDRKTEVDEQLEEAIKQL